MIEYQLIAHFSAKCCLRYKNQHICRYIDDDPTFSPFVDWDGFGHAPSRSGALDGAG